MANGRNQEQDVNDWGDPVFKPSQPKAQSVNDWGDPVFTPEPIETAVDQLDIDEDMTFTDSIGRGVDQLQGLGYSAVEWTGETFDSDVLSAWGREGRLRNIDEAAQYGRGSSIYDIEDLGDFGQWAKETFGTQLPMMAPSIAGGIAGFFVGGPIGAAIGAFIPSTAIGIGEIQKGFKERAGEEAEAGAWAFIGGSAIGALDSVLPAKLGSVLVKKFGREAAEEIAKKTLMRNVSVGALKQGGTEGVTEAIQGLISEVAIAYGTDTAIDDELGWNMLEEGAAGALMGLITGGLAGGVQAQRARRDVADERVEGIPVAPEDQPILDEPIVGKGLTESDIESPIANEDIVKGNEAVDDYIKESAGIISDIDVIDAAETAGIEVEAAREVPVAEVAPISPEELFYFTEMKTEHDRQSQLAAKPLPKKEVKKGTYNNVKELLSYMRKQGRVRIADPDAKIERLREDSKLAQELKSIGLTPKNSVGLFSKKGTFGDADNIDLADMQHALPEGVVIGEQESADPTTPSGYVDRDWILEAISNNDYGGLAEVEATEEFEQFDEAVNRMGLDVQSMTAEEIHAAFNDPAVIAEAYGPEVSELVALGDVTDDQLYARFDESLPYKVGMSKMDEIIEKAIADGEYETGRISGEISGKPLEEIDFPRGEERRAEIPEPSERDEIEALEEREPEEGRVEVPRETISAVTEMDAALDRLDKAVEKIDKITEASEKAADKQKDLLGAIIPEEPAKAEIGEPVVQEELLEEPTPQDLKRLAEQKIEGRKKVRKEQRPADEGLFDVDERKQIDIEEAIPAVTDTELFQVNAQKTSLGFYSQVENTVLTMDLQGWRREEGEAPTTEILAKLKKSGVKKEELEWLALEDYLITQDSWTRDKVAEFVRNNGVNVEEVKAEQDAGDQSTEVEWDEGEIWDDPEAWNWRVEDLVDEKLDEAIDQVMATEKSNNKDLNEEQLRDLVSENFADEVLAKQEELAEVQAEADYRADPILIYSDTNIEGENLFIFGNNEQGYDIRKGSWEQWENRINDDTIYSLGEAKIQAEDYAREHEIIQYDDDGNTVRWEDYTMDGPHENYRELKLTLPDIEGEFIESAHFSDSNIVAFLRVDDRQLNNGQDVQIETEIRENNKGKFFIFNKETDRVLVVNGYDTKEAAETKLDDMELGNELTKEKEVKTYFVDEFQSDWHQNGRKSGYQTGRDAGLVEQEAMDLEDQLFEKIRITFGDLTQEELFVADIKSSLMHPEAISRAKDIIVSGDLSKIEIDQGSAGGAFNRNHVIDLLNSKFSEAELSELVTKRKDIESLRRTAQAERYGVPDAPFKQDGWVNLGLKRAVLDAVENGYEAIAWPNAAVMSDRWSSQYRELYQNQYDRKMPKLMKKITGIQAVQLGEGGFRDLNRVRTFDTTILNGFDTKQDLLNYLPETKDESLINDDGSLRDGLTVSQLSNDKWAIFDKEGADEGYWMIEITPELTKRIMDDGLPLFQRPNKVKANNGKPVDANAVLKDLSKILENVGLSGEVQLNMVNEIRSSITGQTVNANGKFTAKTIDSGIQRIIEISLNAPDPTKTINHEIIHILKNMDVFKPSEWNAMTKAAKADEALMARVRRDWSHQNLTDEQLVEEAVAEMYSEWSYAQDQKGFVRKAFERIQAIFKAIWDAFNNHGYVFAETVFDKIHGGGVMNRPLGAEGRRDVVRLQTSPVKGGLLDVDFGEPDPSVGDYLESHQLETYDKIQGASSKEALSQTLDNLRTNFQDAMLPLLRIQQSIQKAGGQLVEDIDTYMKHTLMTGKIGARLDDLYENTVRPFFEEMNALGIDETEMEAYLYARHAKERNASISAINPEFEEGSGSGMTDAEADAIMAEVEKSGKKADLEKLAAHIDKAIADDLQSRVDSDLISEEQAEQYKARWKFYVPLKGTAEMDPMFATDIDRPFKSKGVSVKGKEFKQAFGRRSQARDILPYIFMQMEETIVRTENNEVAKAFYNMAVANPNEKIWTTKKITMRKSIDPKTGLVVYTPDSRVAAEDADYTVTAKINGKEHRVILNRNNPTGTRLANAMRNLSQQEMSGFVQAVGWFNRYLSTINTSLNPEFVISNAFRDFQLGVVAAGEMNIKDIKKNVIIDYPSALIAAEKAAFGNFEGEWGAIAKEWQDEGGRVFFNQVDDIKQMRKKLSTIMDDAVTGKSISKLIRGTLDVIQKVNLGVESAIRISAYKNLRDAGMSKSKAAQAAKELTVNFNRKGVYGAVINSLFLFANASMQGTTKVLQFAGTKTGREAMGGLIVMGAFAEIASQMVSGDDDDGEKFHNKISEYEKSRNWIVTYGSGKGQYIKIPAPYGLNVFSHLGRAMVEIAMGQKDPLDVTMELLTTAMESFNPIGGSGDLSKPEDVLRLLSPTILDPAVELAVNRDFTGRPIHPEETPFAPDIPDSQKKWGSVSPLIDNLTLWLNRATGGTAIEAGLVDVSPETLEYLFGVLTGGAGTFVKRLADLPSKIMDPSKEVRAQDIPFLRKFAGSKNTWYDKSAFYERAEEIEAVKSYLDGYRAAKDTQGVRRIKSERGAELRLVAATKFTKKRLKVLRNRKRGLAEQFDQGKITRQEYADKFQKIQDQEDRVVTKFNTRYNRTVPR